MQMPTVHFIVIKQHKRIACGIEFVRGLVIAGDPLEVTCDACKGSDDFQNYVLPASSTEVLEGLQPVGAGEITE